MDGAPFCLALIERMLAHLGHRPLPSLRHCHLPPAVCLIGALTSSKSLYSPSPMSHALSLHAFLSHTMAAACSLTPCILMQVISRAHRMGATKTVHVEVLAMRGTMEEAMLPLASTPTQQHEDCDAGSSAAAQAAPGPQGGSAPPPGRSRHAHTSGLASGPASTADTTLDSGEGGTDPTAAEDAAAERAVAGIAASAAAGGSETASALSAAACADRVRQERNAIFLRLHKV